MALKINEPAMMFAGAKLSPDELDQDNQYIILNPSVGTAYFGTGLGTGDLAVAFIPTQIRADYPRTMNMSILGVAGGQGGTGVFVGKNQFGGAITETLGFATAAGGGTANGTKVFSRVDSGTITYVGLGGTAIGSAHVGVKIAGTPAFGIPARLGATTDVKAATWVDADVAKSLNLSGAGTSAIGGTAQSDVKIDVAGGIVSADSFVITYRSSHNNTEDGNIFST